MKKCVENNSQIVELFAASSQIVELFRFFINEIQTKLQMTSTGARRKSRGKNATSVTDVVESIKNIKKASDLQVAALLGQMPQEDVDKLADLLEKLSVDVEAEPKSDKKKKDDALSPSEKRGASFAQWFVSLCSLFRLSFLFSHQQQQKG